MPNLLHIDASVNAPEASVSRRLTARAADNWRAANPDGTVVYRDLGVAPPPHLDVDTGLTFLAPPDQHTPAQAETYARGLAYAQEIIDADAIVLGMGLYNFGAPSSVKAWVDHLIIPGVTVDMVEHAPLLDATPLHVILSRGGGYGADTPRAGWDHAETWLPHGLSMTGLVPDFIIAELTLARVNPALAQFIGLADASLAAAEARVDELFASAVA